MKNFFAENTYNIIKMFLNQIGLSMLGLIMAMATINASPWVRVLVGIVCVIFYLWILYVMIYEIGQKDGIKIESGRLRLFKLKGFWIAFCANIPNMIIGILTLIGGIFYYIIGVDVPSWAAYLYGICNAIGKMLQAMYLPIISAVASNSYWPLMFTFIPPVIVSGFAYALGVKYCNGFANTLTKKSK